MTSNDDQEVLEVSSSLALRKSQVKVFFFFFFCRFHGRVPIHLRLCLRSAGACILDP